MFNSPVKYFKKGTDPLFFNVVIGMHFAALNGKGVFGSFSIEFNPTTLEKAIYMHNKV